jgi:acetyl-CoA carboxylase biotin carboxyl carrier protein
MADVSPDDVRVLSRLLHEHGWSSLRLRIGTDTLELASSPPESPPAFLPAAQPLPATAVPAAAANPVAVPGPAPAGAPTVGTGEPAPLPAGWVAVSAPHIGTFYAAPSPGADPYVQLGQPVEVGQDVCLIEVMKLYTPVKAEVAGIVVEVVAQSGDLVEYGQRLLVIDPGGRT